MLCVKGLLGCDLISLLLDNDIKAFDALKSPVARPKIISGNLEHFWEGGGKEHSRHRLQHKASDNDVIMSCWSFSPLFMTHLKRKLRISRAFDILILIELRKFGHDQNLCKIGFPLKRQSTDIIPSGWLGSKYQLTNKTIKTNTKKKKKKKKTRPLSVRYDKSSSMFSGSKLRQWS